MGRVPPLPTPRTVTNAQVSPPAGACVARDGVKHAWRLPMRTGARRVSGFTASHDFQAPSHVGLLAMRAPYRAPSFISSCLLFLYPFGLPSLSLKHLDFTLVHSNTLWPYYRRGVPHSWFSVTLTFLSWNWPNLKVQIYWALQKEKGAGSIPHFPSCGHSLGID